FNPGVPDLPCLSLLAGDAGVQRSDDCGTTWSFASGVHTLITYEAAITGTPGARRILLANDDVGWASRDTDGSWIVEGSDAWAVDALRTEGDEFVGTAQQDDVNVRTLSGTDQIPVPAPPKPLIRIGGGHHFAPRFFAIHQLVVATTSSSDGA